MNYKARAGAAFMLLLLGVTATANGATISTVTELALLVGNFQEPAGVLPEASIKNLLTGQASVEGRGVTGTRATAQSFVVDAADFPFGIEVTGFVINARSGPSPAAITFGVELFPVANPQAAAITPSGASLVSNPSIGAGSLVLPVSTAPKTITFGFDTAVTLAPGAYVWQFMPSGTTTAAFTWERRTSNLYAPGARYESGVVADSADFQFGLIGMEAPEPASLLSFILGFIVIGASLARQSKTSA
jgi:hypothetical protein